MGKTVGLAINGANSSGKSRLIRQMRSDPRLSDVVFFEMDNLCYWRPDRQISEAEAAKWFADDACSHGSDATVRSALLENVQRSDPRRRTVKLAFCRLCAAGRTFFTVTPRILRGPDEAEFFDLLARVWGTEIIQVAVIPSVFGHIRNVVRRRDRRWARILRESRSMRGNRANYAIVITNRLFGGMKDDVEALVKLML